eukprot:SAG11_NODE_2693_length_3090_cov_1.761953_5_plen_36_part_01
MSDATRDARLAQLHTRTKVDGEQLRSPTTTSLARNF